MSPTDAINASARVEHALGGRASCAPNITRRQNERSNLGVGDFDLPERAYATDSITDTLPHAQDPRDRQEGVQRAAVRVRFSPPTRRYACSIEPDHPRARRVHRRRRRPGGRAARPRVRARRRTSTSPSAASTRCAPACCSRPGGGTARSSPTPTAPTPSRAWTSSTRACRAPTRIASAIRWSTTRSIKAGWYVQDDFRRRANLQVSLGLRQELQTHVDDAVEPGAARRLHVERGQEDQGPRRLRHLLRLVRHRTSTSRRSASTAVTRSTRSSSEPHLPDERCRLARGCRPACIRAADARPADHSAGVDRLRAAAHAVAGLARRLHVDARLQHAALGQRQRADQRRAARSDGRQRHRDPVDAASARPDRVNVGAERALPAAPHLRQRDVSVRRTRGTSPTPLSACRPTATIPIADWGPSAQDVRHRLFFMSNSPLGNGVRAGLNVQGSSAPPYNITTGLDDNGDTVFNDRAAGVEPQQRARRGPVDVELRAHQVDQPRRRCAAAPAGHARHAASAPAARAARRRSAVPAAPAAVATARRW